MKTERKLILVSAVSTCVGLAAGFLLGWLLDFSSARHHVHIAVREAGDSFWHGDAARFSAPNVGYPRFLPGAMTEGTPTEDIAVIEFSIDSRRYNVYRIFELGSDLYVELDVPGAPPSERQVSRVPPQPLETLRLTDRSESVALGHRAAQIRRAIEYLASLSTVPVVQFQGSLATRAVASR